MGLDGGTYITRSDVLRGQCWDLNKADNSRSTRGGSVRGTHKKARLDPKAARQLKWTTCALSEQPLRAPLVADFLGSLYNKVAVLEFLLGRAGHFADTAAEHRYMNQLNAAAGGLDHLQSKRDIFAIHLKMSQPSTPPDVTEVSNHALYRCPITDIPCLSQPFSALTTCGHVFSARALLQAAEEEQLCALCSQPYDESCIIPLNGDPEQVEQLARNMAGRRASAKRKKTSLCLDQSHDGQPASAVAAPKAVPHKRLRAV